MLKSSATFRFAGHDLDAAAGAARFHFEIEKGSETHRFIETLRFPTKDIAWKTIPPELLTTILDALALALGISYWKLYCPKNIEVAFTLLTKAQAAFWNTVYTKGLGEFYYKNKIDFRGLVQFLYDRSDTTRLPRPSTTLGARNDGVENRSLLQLGGGKDSIVSAEILKEAKKPFTLFMLNESPLQQSVARLMGFQTIVFSRTLDPQIFALNGRHDTFNGHVPISVLYAFCGLFAAILYDYRFVIASNESSSNYGNVAYKGEEINHQWSKSLEFEMLFRDYVNAFITSDITYFSLLRPFNELEVVKIFSRHTQYFSTFSSCNENFKTTRSVILSKAKDPAGKRWCRRCPKCAFVFACLAAYLPKKEVVRIVGKNLFAEPALMPLFQELLGLKNFKPFECVGTPQETRRAFALASKRGEYMDDPIMKMFEDATARSGGADDRREDATARSGGADDRREDAFDREAVLAQGSTKRMHNSDTIPEEFRGVVQNALHK